MANKHFGRIGDVWKHLPLAEILSIEQPRQYWETHAGSAYYKLTHSMERDYGVFSFYSLSKKSEVLSLTKYQQLLDSLISDDDDSRYPGSPLIALYYSSSENFLFCDLDGDSLNTIADSASLKGKSEYSPTLIRSDGVLAVKEAFLQLSEDEIADTLIFIDPGAGDDPFIESAVRPSPISLYCTLAKKGARVILWYGFDSPSYRLTCREKIKAAIDKNKVEVSNLWCGEIYIISMEVEKPSVNPGVMGCGLLCANLNADAIAKCSLLGEELEKIYKDSKFPTGESGAIYFQTVTF